MFDHTHYVPALKWRMGEFKALEDIKQSSQTHLTPLIEITSVSWDFELDQPSKSLDEHYQAIPTQMEAAWGNGKIFVDLPYLISGETMAGGVHPVLGLFAALRARGLSAIPVTELSRDAAYQSAVRAVIATDNRGLCLRLRVQDFLPQAATNQITQLLQTLQVVPENVDLVLDLQSVNGTAANLYGIVLPNAINAIPELDRWRSLTMLSGAFPTNLTGLNPGITTLPRTDWTLWLSIRANPPRRMPTFGDFAIAHPEQPDEIDPRIMQMSAGIRYTDISNWIIFRGVSVRRPGGGGFTQFQQLSQNVMQHPAFQGAAFSWGDQFIESCAAGGPTGNATTWRKVGTNHHLEMVIYQIAMLPAI